MIYEFKGHRPVVDPSAFIHPQATVTGNVSIGKNVYIGPGAAIRGDWGRILIEDGCNVQENCTIHMFPGVTVWLKEGAHIGHGAVVHGATIGRNCLIGMNSVIMDNVEIGDECIIGALSFIKAGEKIPARSVFAGNPARRLKDVSDEMLQWKSEGTALYQALPKNMQEDWRPCEPLAPGEDPASPDAHPASPPTDPIPKEYKPWKETPTTAEEPAPDYGKRMFTKEEYLQMEEMSLEKHEYYKGEIFAMSGPKLPHVIIATNMVSILGRKLRHKPCRPFTGDLRIYVEKEDLLTYPDLSIVCGKPITLDDDKWNLMNPSVLVEVLSPSTRDYDQGKKFQLYKALTTLKEYILIDSQAVGIEIFRKNKQGFWTPQKYDKLKDKLSIETVDLSIPLREIYEDTDLPQ